MERSEGLMRRSLGPALIVLAWLVTRLPLVLIALDVMPYPWPETILGDIGLYEGWEAVLRRGHFPADDWNWQYPPAAALVMLAPGLLPGGYLGGFLTLAAVADAAVLALLLGAAHRGGSRLGACAWVLGVPLLGVIAYARYDLIVAAVAVGALVAAGRPTLAGALAGIGAMLKVWPALLLFGLEPGRVTRRALAAAVTAGVAVTAVLALLLPGSLSFVGYQRGRGVQIESVPGTVFLVGRHLGWEGTNPFRYGAREFVGPGVAVVAVVAPALTLAVLCWLFYWRRRARWHPSTPYDAALTATLLAVVTSRVLSPQYLLWLLALAGLCLTQRATSQRTVCGLILVCAALTQLEFPVLWAGVVHAHVAADLVLLTRNVLLVVAAVLSAVALWRSTTRDPGDRSPESAGTAARGAAEPGAAFPLGSPRPARSPRHAPRMVSP
jgi:Glycosyltransferase family 87